MAKNIYIGVDNIARKVKKIYIGKNEELQLVDYIESSGNGYIDTGIIPNNNLTTEIIYSYTAEMENSDGVRTVCGAYGSNNNRYIPATSWGSYTSHHMGVAPDGTQIIYQQNFDTAPHKLIYNDAEGKIYFDDNFIQDFGGVTDSYIQKTLTLFAYNTDSDGITSYGNYIRIYSCKLIDKTTNTVLRDLVPIKRTNGEYYMYDKITNKLLQNKGTGKFIGGFVNTELEYIESTGTQYIDTGIVPKSTTRVVIDYAYSSIPTVTEMMGWGSSGSTEAFAWGWRADGGLFSTVSSNYTYSSANVPNDTNRHVFDLKSGSQKLDGVEYATDTIGDTATTGQTMYLFGLHGEWNTSTAVSLCKSKIYSCKIYDGDTLVRDFIPKSDTNGDYYLFDKVNNVAYYNKSTGNFLGGNSVTKSEIIPLTNIARKVIKGYVGVKETYKVLDYIESTGTQYINTGVKTSNSLRVETIFKTRQGIIHSSGSTYSSGLLGARVSSTNSSFIYTSGTNYEYIGNGTASIQLDKNANTSDLTTLKYSTTFYELTCGSYSKSGELSISIDTPLEIVLFSYNQNGDMSTNCGTYQLYSCKIYDGDTLIRDLIPIQTSEGIVCLYDKVSKKKFLNKGTGAFIAGEETGEILEVSKARLFFSKSKILKSLGVVATKSYSLYGGGIASTQDYFIMAGGQTTEGGSTQSSGSEAYDLDFVRKAITGISARRDVSGGSIGGYALFLGGYTGSSSSYSACSSTVEAYDNSLTKKSVTSLTAKQHSPSVAFNDKHLMVFGAAQYSQTAKTVDSYDTNLVKTQCTDLASNRKSLAYTRCGNYLMAAGGSSSTSASGGQVTTVEAYSNDLVKTTCSGIDTAVHHPSGGWVNGYAMIVGGSQNSESGVCINTMNIYDENLTKRTSMKFPVAANDITKATISNGKYAIFGSGRLGSGGSYTYPSTHYIYDEDLVLIKTIENCGFSGNVQRWMATIGDIACRYNYGTAVGAIGYVEEEE